MTSSPFPASADRRDTVQRVSVTRLVAHAKKHQIVDVGVAEGVCLTKSLELCLAAEEMGIPTQLVMWPINHDAKFLDHWAVRINLEQVIDLTYIQINCRETDRIVFALSDYPANFQAPYFYNPAPLLAQYRDARLQQRDTVGPSFFIALRAAMLRQDLARIGGFGALPQGLRALFAYIKFRVYFGLARLQRRLQSRHAALVNDVVAPPDKDDR